MHAKGNMLAAVSMAYELKLIPAMASHDDHCTLCFKVRPMARERAMMHRMLDGKKG